MGRPLFSTTLPAPAPVVRVAGTDTPTYEKWSHWNAFDPDSDEFFQRDDVVYEAFLTPEQIAAQARPRSRSRSPTRVVVTTDPRARIPRSRSPHRRILDYDSTFTGVFPELLSDGSSSEGSASGRETPDALAAAQFSPPISAVDSTGFWREDEQQPRDENSELHWTSIPRPAPYDGDLASLTASLRDADGTTGWMSQAQMQAFWRQLVIGGPFRSLPTPPPAEVDEHGMPSLVSPEPASSPTQRRGHARSPSAPAYQRSPSPTRRSGRVRATARAPYDTVRSPHDHVDNTTLFSPPPPHAPPRVFSWAEYNASNPPISASRMSLSHIAPTSHGQPAASLRVHQ